MEPLILVEVNVDFHSLQPKFMDGKHVQFDFASVCHHRYTDHLPTDTRRYSKHQLPEHSQRPPEDTGSLPQAL
jgi:hypothetical protein